MENRNGERPAVKMITKEELAELLKQGTLIEDEPVGDIPGEGSYTAYFGLNIKGRKPFTFHMPQETADMLKPDTEKLEGLMDEACLLYAGIWKLADARCREIIKEGASDARRAAEYAYEQGVLYRKLLEAETKMEDTVYGQIEKGIASGTLPGEVEELLAKALEVQKRIGPHYQDMYIEKAKAAEAELKKLAECPAPGAADGGTDTVTECIRAQQKAHRASRPMHWVASLRPFHDGYWLYRGQRAISSEEYEYARDHDFDWTRITSTVEDIYDASSATFRDLRMMIEKEYGL